jgi:hypothetical protein
VFFYCFPFILILSKLTNNKLKETEDLVVSCKKEIEELKLTVSKSESQVTEVLKRGMKICI